MFRDLGLCFFYCTKYSFYSTEHKRTSYISQILTYNTSINKYALVVCALVNFTISILYLGKIHVVHDLIHYGISFLQTTVSNNLFLVSIDYLCFLKTSSSPNDWSSLLHEHIVSFPAPYSFFLNSTLIRSNVPFTSIPVRYELQNVLFLIRGSQGRFEQKHSWSVGEKKEKEQMTHILYIE